jgi:hypothetical protein
MATANLLHWHGGVAGRARTSATTLAFAADNKQEAEGGGASAPCGGRN